LALWQQQQRQQQQQQRQQQQQLYQQRHSLHAVFPWNMPCLSSPLHSEPPAQMFDLTKTTLLVTNFVNLHFRLQVESPIFQNLPRLPTPLGSFVHTAPLFRQLPLSDRATAAPLVKPLLEHDLDDALYNEYDSQSAYELFRAASVSKNMYEKFLAPMLLVTLFAPPTELSAAAALGKDA
jgi:hypothetical protein